MKSNLLGIVAICCAAGCARVSTTTALNSDGSFQRTITYTIAQGQLGTKKVPSSFQALFKVGEKGASDSWKQTSTSQDKQLTVGKRYASGSPSNPDIVLLTDAGKPLVTSRTEVKKLPDGKLSYDEFIDWVGPKAPKNPNEMEGLDAALKESLPARYQSTPKIAHLSNLFVTTFLHSFFGPPDPWFLQAITNPDLAKLKLQDAMEAIVRTKVKAELPDLTEAELSHAVQVLRGYDALKMKSLASKNAPTESQDTNASTPLLFVATYPGKLVETDGVPTSDGKVYWSLFSTTAQWSPIHLHLLVDVSGN